MENSQLQPQALWGTPTFHYPQCNALLHCCALGCLSCHGGSGQKTW